MKKEDILKVLKNKNQLKAAARELSIAELNKLKDRMIDVIEMATLEKEEEEQEANIRRQKAEELLKRAKAEGLDVVDMLAAAGFEGSDLKKDLKRGRSHKKAVKYRLGDNEWSGAGRPPRWIQDLKSQDIDIEKYRAN